LNKSLNEGSRLRPSALVRHQHVANRQNWHISFCFFGLWVFSHESGMIEARVKEAQRARRSK
jgi:hypothetical protein